MPRIRPVDPAAATGAAAIQLAGTKQAFGSIPNMFATAAQSPAALTALNGYFGALGKGALGQRIGERIAIAVAQQNGCDYCLSAHSAIGAMRGLDVAELALAKRGQASEPKAAAALAFALEVLRTRGKVEDVTMASARNAGLVDEDLVEIIAHVALNVFTNFLNNVAQTDIDFPVVALDQAA